MAQKSPAKKNTQSSNRKPSPRSGKTSSGSSSRSQKTRVQEVSEESESFFSIIWSSSWGKMLYALLAILLLIAVDFLVSMNHYDRFFTILGVEIVAAMVLGWIIFLIVERRKQHLSDDDPNNQ
ncbi:MAG: hypothetical protein IKD90_03630 [Clostridiales bacterium]|nr:hypothetical protein [Clostridiales bacterium]